MKAGGIREKEGRRTSSSFGVRKVRELPSDPAAEAMVAEEMCGNMHSKDEGLRVVMG